MKRYLCLVIMVMFCMGGVFEDADKLYEDGDYSKAIKMWQRSCDGGDTRSCYSLETYIDSAGTPRRAIKRQRRFIKKLAMVGI